MTNIKRTVLVLILFINVFAVKLINAAPSKPYILRNDKKRLIVDSLTADEKGNLKYKRGRMTAGLSSKKYIYAYVPLPKEVMAAIRKFNSKNYRQAIKDFDKAYDKYRYLGWGAVCIYYSAKSYEAMGKKEEAVAKAEILKEAPKNPDEIPYYLKSKQLEAEILIAEKDYEKAKKVLNYISKSSDKESAMFANNAKGDILKSQGKDNEALFLYMRNIILFNQDKSKESLESINKTVEILKKQQHPRLEEFENMK